MSRESNTLYQYRILTVLLFKDLDYIHFDPKTGLVRIEKMSAFSVELGYRSHKIRRGLEELQRLNILYDVKFAYNKAFFYMERCRQK